MLNFYHVKTIHFTVGCCGFGFNSLPTFFSLPFLSVPFHFVSLLLRFALITFRHNERSTQTSKGKLVTRSLLPALYLMPHKIIHTA